MYAMGRSIEMGTAGEHLRWSVAWALLALLPAACGASDEWPPAVAAPTSEQQLPPGAEAGTEAPAGRSVAARRPVDAAVAGTITGVVVYRGPPPPPQPLAVVGEAFCVSLARQAGGLRNEALRVEQGHLAGVFVWIASGLEGWRFAEPRGAVELDQVGCTYVPHVLGLRQGQTLRLRNSDPVLHNVHSIGRRNGEKNLAMPLQGQELELVFKKPEVMVTLQCDVHAWMKAFVGVVEHPCFGVSDAQGVFVIDNVPPGEYHLRLWHEVLGDTEVELSLGPGETVDLGPLSF